jgi:hypothetical protein
MTKSSLFQNFGAAVCEDQRFVKLLSYLEAQSFDGTEVFGIIDQALPGLENAAAVAAIKRAIEARYANTIKLDAIVEISGLDDGAAI